MSHSLRETQLRSGAVLDGESHLALHFGEAEDELRAARESCVVVDRSFLGRLMGSGPDLLGLLNRLSTNRVDQMRADEGRPTVLTTNKGRIVERLFVHHLGQAGVLLVVGPGPDSALRVAEHLRRYTFAEVTGLADQSETLCQLAVVGPRAPEALRAAGFDPPEAFCSYEARFEGGAVHVLGQDGLSADGFSIAVPAESAGSLWHALNLATRRYEGRPAGSLAAEAWRVLRGYPLAGHELTEEYNPLEAGLRDAVAFDKGCYVGQEVVARLNTYDKVSRGLFGVRIAEGAALPATDTPLFFQEHQVGRLTSAVIPPGWRDAIGLAYLKRKVAEPGIELTVGEPTSSLSARMVRLPFEV